LRGDIASGDIGSRGTVAAKKPGLAPRQRSELVPVPMPDGVPGTVKPRLRGWVHALAAPLALAAGIVLVARAPTVSATIAAGIFAAAAVELLGLSAIYHLGTWSPRVRVILRRVDHANILLLIAGTYTPLTVLALSGATRLALLCAVWGGAALGWLPSCSSWWAGRFIRSAASPMA